MYHSDDVEKGAFGESKLANNKNIKRYPVRIDIFLKGRELSKTLLRILRGVLVRIYCREFLFRVAPQS